MKSIASSALAAGIVTRIIEALKPLHRDKVYSQRRGLVERAMVNYVFAEKSVLGRLADVHVARGAGGGVSGHLLVVAKRK